MPIFYLRRLTGRERTQNSNQQLARYLAFVAGAVNAGGFLAVRQYSSHVTGIVSAIADNLALGDLPVVFTGLAAVFSFLLGAMCTASMVLWARRRALESEYALPLVDELHTRLGLSLCNTNPTLPAELQVYYFAWPDET